MTTTSADPRSGPGAGSGASRGRVTVRLVVAAVVVSVLAVVGWRWVDRTFVLDRPLPARGASVTEVATAYLDAAVRQDCAFTQALTLERAFAWCVSPTMTAYSDVERPTFLPAADAGRDEWCVGFTMTTTESADGSLSEGTLPWNLCFVATDQGWRVHDQGFI